MIYPKTTYTLYLFWPALKRGEWNHGAYPISESKRPILVTDTTLDAAREIRTALLAYLATLDEDQDALNRVAPGGLYGRNWQNADILIEKSTLTKRTTTMPTAEEVAALDESLT